MSSKKLLSEVYRFFEGDEFRANVLIDKYLLKDKEGKFLETSVEEVIDRVCKVLSKQTDNPKEYFKRFKEAIDDFKGVCPQGSILAAAGNTDYLQSLSNCFVIDSPEDSIAGIFKTSQEEAQLLKRRGGCGFDISSLRPQNSSVKNAAISSSGAAGWAENFSSVCRSIAMNGRRGALILTLDIKHPDALAFAQMKEDSTKVTGANVSLKITDEFMNAVVNKETFIQQWPVDSDKPEVVVEVDARKLWGEICKCSHSMAEPGLLFWDTIKKYLPADYYDAYKVTSTNPCSEISLSPRDSCRLTTICLTKYVGNKFKEDAYFDFGKFEQDVRTAMRMLDAVVDAELEVIEKILSKLKKEKKQKVFKDASLLDVEIDLWEGVKEAGTNGRRTGLGTHGLADCLAQLCTKYDTDKAHYWVDRIYGSLCHTAYDESVDMAKEKGAFPVWDWETEKDCPFFDHFPSWLLEKMKKYGRRNISILTNAPTGSISILSGTSSGIEPNFRLSYTRRRKINPNDQDTKADFVDKLGDKWHSYPVFEKNVVTYFEEMNTELPSVSSNSELLKYLPDYFVTSDLIDWRKRIKLQAVCQKYIDHSISSTINLPKDTTIQTVKSIYTEAWKKGLKGVTVYRDGCRSGVLIANEEGESSERPEGISRYDAPVRPEVLPCEIHPVKVQGQEYIVIVGFMGPSVYEVFAGKHCNHIPYKQLHGTIRKGGRKKYYLNFEHEGEEFEVDINKYFENPEYAAITRLVSTALRHGSPIAFVVEQLQKSSDFLVGFEKCLARVLKKYAPKEDLARNIKTCTKCDSTNIDIRFEEGCMTVTCLDCSTVDAKCN